MVSYGAYLAACGYRNDGPEAACFWCAAETQGCPFRLHHGSKHLRVYYTLKAVLAPLLPSEGSALTFAEKIGR
jgi:hypothetical protein